MTSDLSKTALNRLFKELQENSYAMDFSQLNDSVGLKKVYQKRHLIGYEICHEGEIHISKKDFIKWIEVSKIKEVSLNKNHSIIKINTYENNLLKVLSEIKKIQSVDPIWVAIDGFAGAGKTTLANRLGLIMDANVFHTDDFFKSPEIDSNDNLSQYGFNIDYTKINQSIINQINQKQPVNYQPFDFKSHRHLSSIALPYRQINIFEGAYVLHPYLKNNWNLKVFYGISRLRQYQMIYQRSGFKKLWQFMTKWIPKERRYVKGLSIKQQCNIVIDMK